MALKKARIVALIDDKIRIAPNIAVQMGQAGILHSITKPLDRKKISEVMQYVWVVVMAYKYVRQSNGIIYDIKMIENNWK